MDQSNRFRSPGSPSISRIAAAICVVLFLSFSSVGQEATPSPPVDDTKKPIAVRTDLVTLTLTVTDLYGRYVSGLSKDAFTIIDNNKEQEVTFFSDSDAPISVGILFDVSGSMSGDKIKKARTALQRFISSSHPSDEYFLIAFNSKA